jgi:hypothetical protein
LWPIVGRSSFERVTGPKHDFWLVRTVGGLAIATGVSLGVAVVTGRKRMETSALGMTTGLVFALASLRAGRTHSRLYLADAAVETAFALAWIRSWGSPTPTSLDSLTTRGR